MIISCSLRENDWIWEILMKTFSHLVATTIIVLAINSETAVTYRRTIVMMPTLYTMYMLGVFFKFTCTCSMQTVHVATCNEKGLFLLLHCR